jgi:glycosyltransferase involved in cell wall biosynthesis
VNILTFTNTYTPHVGGVARSVDGFARVYRALGHRVVVVAPRFEGAPEHETDVVRFPALQHFNGSDFSVPVPVPGILSTTIEALNPDIVHSHHPFLLGDTALRVAAARGLPVVFTHHTMYEKYTHYVPGDSPRMQRFAIELATGYCNLCDAVIAPSETVAEILRERDVEVRIEVIPTGVDLAVFRRGDRARGRRSAGLPADAFVVGHVGRLAPEKNLGFLARALARFAARDDRVRVLIAGAGPSKDEIAREFEAEGVSDRLAMLGVLDRKALADAYRALDVFAFASQSETQGLVVAEAMAAGVPVAAIDAPGVREVVRNGHNGRLLQGEDIDEFVAALAWVRGLAPAAAAELRAGVSETAERFSIQRTAQQALALYADLIRAGAAARPVAQSPWESAKRRLAEEWKIARNIATAAGDAWLTLDRSDDEQ